MNRRSGSELQACAVTTNGTAVEDRSGQRTMNINAVRAHLAEFGVVAGSVALSMPLLENVPFAGCLHASFHVSTPKPDCAAAAERRVAGGEYDLFIRAHSKNFMGLDKWTSGKLFGASS